MRPPAAVQWLALALVLGHAAAQWNTQSVSRTLDQRRDLIRGLADVLSQEYVNFTQSSLLTNPTTYFANSGNFNFGDQQNGKVLDSCGNELPNAWNPQCDRKISGDTKGCECKGTELVRSVVVKAVNSEFDSNAKRNLGNHAAFAATKKMLDAYESAASKQDFENKWMYFGAVDGAYSIYPGRMWPRDSDGTCGRKYDPRLRPWYLSASNGPKNVIFILDSSGSMGQFGRMELLKNAAKQVIDSLTFADYIGLVDFDGDARTMKGLNFLAPAAKGFRDEAKIFIDMLQDSGGTNYEDGFRRAFEMADISYANNYDSGCQTVYVFLTDGECTQGDCSWPEYEIQARQSRNVKREETFLVIGFGKAVTSEGDPRAALQSLSCVGKGVFVPVQDRKSSSSTDAGVAEFELTAALSKFSEYFQTKNTLKKRELVTYTEVYGMTWDGVSEGQETTTASLPIYDKSDQDRWKFLGVVAIDVMACALELALLDSNPTIQDPPAKPEATKFDGCTCAESYTYNGQQFTGGECTTLDWPVAWCATEGCGIPTNPDSISTGFWADCKPFGARAVLEEQLRKSGEECGKDPLPECELEALRPADTKCRGVTAPQSELVVSCEASTVTRLEGYNYRTKLPGFESISESSWKGNTGGSYDSSRWNTDESSCDQCSNTDMQPQCALPPQCGKGVPVPVRAGLAADDAVAGAGALSPVPWMPHLLAAAAALLLGLAA